MIISGVGVTDTGKNRERNEDAIYIDDNLGLYIVCDGMGGHSAGELASKTAIERVVNFLQQNRSTIDNTIPDDSQSKSSLALLVKLAVEDACKTIYNLGQENPEYKGMGTTLTMMLVKNDVGILGHVGDSRLYICRHNQTDQLSHDHSMVQELVEQGVMTLEKALESPYAHILSRAVGTQPVVQVDTLVIDILPGDKFLVCSDGLFDVVDLLSELGGFLAARDPEGVPKKLIDLAIDRDSSDNISALIITAEPRDDEVDHQQSRSDEVMLKIEVVGSMYIFRGLELQELVRIVNLAYVLDIQSGNYVFREDEPGGSLFIILEGDLCVLRGEHEIAKISKGNHFGEMSLLTKSERSASVKALTDCKLLQITHDDFESLVREHPQTGVSLLSAISIELCARLRSSNDERYASML